MTGKNELRMQDFNKSNLRKEIGAQLANLSTEVKKEKSETIAKELFGSREWQDAKKIFVYVSTANEVDTNTVIVNSISAGKEVFVPKIIGPGLMKAVRINTLDDLKPNKYGILEPKYDCNELAIPFDKSERQLEEQAKAEDIQVDFDLAIVPCVAASLDGKRLGHGGGYYDRFLEGKKAATICICFKEQVRNDIATDEHDILMDKVIYA